MNFGDTYKIPLHSYIQSRVGTLENNLEEVIKNSSNINANNLEQQIDRETNKFIDDVKNHVKKMQDDIKSHRPTDSNAPDYDIHMKQYQQFVQNSTTGVNEVTNWIKSMFDKILSIVKTIIQWIKDNAKTIIEIIKDIRDAFKLINNFFA
jgi:phage-related protein